MVVAVTSLFTDTSASSALLIPDGAPSADGRARNQAAGIHPLLGLVEARSRSARAVLNRSVSRYSRWRVIPPSSLPRPGCACGSGAARNTWRGKVQSRNLVALQFGKRRAISGHSHRRRPQGHFMGGDIGQAEFVESSLDIRLGRGGQRHALTGRFSGCRDEIATLRGLCPQCRPFSAEARRSCPGRSCRRRHRLLLGECWRRRGNRGWRRSDPSGRAAGTVLPLLLRPMHGAVIAILSAGPRKSRGWGSAQ
jgi:hypothetical protein